MVKKRFSFEASFAKRCDALVSDNLYNLLSLLNSYFNRRLMKDMRTFIVKTSIGWVIYGIMPPGFNYSGYTESIFKYRYGIYSSREIALSDSTINFIIREADSYGITAITFTVSSEDEFSVKTGNFISRFFRNSSKFENIKAYNGTVSNISDFEGYDMLILDKGNLNISSLILDKIKFKGDSRQQLFKMIISVIKELGYEVTNYSNNDKTIKLVKDYNGIINVSLWFSDDISMVSDFVRCWNKKYNKIWVSKERNINPNGSGYIMLYGYFREA